MRKIYTQLTIKGREDFFLLQKEGMSVSEAAIRLGKDRSTFYRELRRNVPNKKLGYLPDKAQILAGDRKARLQPKLKKHRETLKYVTEKLKEGWSPEIISGRIKKEGLVPYVSPETIYQYIYSSKGKEQNLYQYLAKAKTKRGKIKGRVSRGKILDRMSIDDRPESIKGEFGHYEGDLIINQGSVSRNVSVVIEKKTRYIYMMKNETKESGPVIQKIFNALVPLHFDARKSITFDNGKEFAKHGFLRSVIGMNTYFCDPHSPWQKGQVERVNASIRRFLPKKIHLNTVSGRAVQNIQNKLNDMPRKCLGFMTPRELFTKEIDVRLNNGQYSLKGLENTHFPRRVG